MTGFFMPPSLTLLYTHHLRGDLAILPRLYTRLRQLRTRAVENGGRVLVFDLGESCAPEVWHCGVTGGRSMLVALDGMGYDAARLDPSVMQDARQKMGEFVRLVLVDEHTPYRADDVQAFIGTPQPDSDASLFIALDVEEQAALQARTLTLSPLSAGQIGEVTLQQNGDTPWVLTTMQVHPFNPALPPDPTIAGVIDFIESEARYAGRKRNASA